MTKTPFRVLVVDDSLFMRAAIKRLLDARPEFCVIDMAKDGKEAVEKVAALRPDIVTMDFNMPRKNGVEAVREIMQRCPTPVLMFSAHTRQGAKETFDALHAGAFDFVAKPAGEVSAQLDGIADDLCRKLAAAARSTPRPKPAAQARTSLRTTRPMAAQELRASRTMAAVSPNPRVLFIAISTGGPVALSRVIPQLPASMRTGVVIVQHMPATFTGALAERLNAESQLQVREAVNGDMPAPGLVLVAPGGTHLKVETSGALRLADGPLVHGCRPAADITMKNAAAAYGRRAIGLVMTGMGKDGAAGLLAIKKAGGKTFAQDKESSVMFGMPQAALELDAVDEIVVLDDMPTKLQQL
ncbi:MAG: chemotaxis response regulator protein-glutamate methylesterase [Myxococcales bacterium]|nr:chemotaxis response regulator protein-glutamate methylesterase [Myxococcales bacterium]